MLYYYIRVLMKKHMHIKYIIKNIFIHKREPFSIIIFVIICHYLE